MPKQEVTINAVEDLEGFFDNLKQSALSWHKEGHPVTIKQENYYRPVYNDEGSIVDQIYAGCTFEIYIGLPDKQPQ